MPELAADLHFQCEEVEAVLAPDQKLLDTNLQEVEGCAPSQAVPCPGHMALKERSDWWFMKTNELTPQAQLTDGVILSFLGAILPSCRHAEMSAE